MADLQHVPQAASKPINRREFLYYLGGASIVLTVTTIAGFLIASPTPRTPQLGYFPVAVDRLSPNADRPINLVDARAWIVHVQGGILALDGICPFRYPHQLVKWVDPNHRFECPACGSKFQLDGSYIEGIAPHGLNYFALEVVTAQGTRRTEGYPQPIPIEDAESVVVDTNRLWQGLPRT